jgi:hypothetical protein
LEILKISICRFDLYQKLCLVSVKSLYWQLPETVKMYIDAYYKSEVEYSNNLDTQSKYLEKLSYQGIIDDQNKSYFLMTINELKQVSEGNLSILT